MKNSKKSLVVVSSLFLCLGAVTLSSMASKSTRTVHKYEVVFSGAESGTKPGTCTKIIPAKRGAEPKVHCSQGVPENVKTAILQSNESKVEVSSGGSGVFVYTATQIK
jgi:hypothetical protein